MTPLETTIARCRAEGRPITLTALGGEPTVLAAAPAAARSVFFADIVGALVADWSVLSDRVRAQDLIMDGLRTADHPIAYAAAVDRLLAGDAADALDANALADALLARARDAQANAYVRSRAVEGLFRLALLERVAPYDLLSLFDRLRADDDPEFLYHMPRLVGAAVDQWRDYRLAAVLDRLAAAPGCEVEATVERGMLRLARALAADNADDVIAGLRLAREYFADAFARDGERLDARAFAAVSALLVAFAEREPAEAVADHVAALEEAIAIRRLWRMNTAPRPWLQPRYDAELAWLALGNALKEGAARLNEPSWRDAVPTMRLTLDLYTASRTYALNAGGGLERMLQPRIEAAFLRREGLRNHLEQFLEEVGDTGPWHDVAQRLRQRLDAARRGDPPGKSQEPAAIRCWRPRSRTSQRLT